MKRETKSDKCAEWLVTLLEGNPMRMQAALEQGKPMGYGRSMIHRTRARMPQIIDTKGRQHPHNQWLLDPAFTPATCRSAEEQIAKLNDWLAKHDPLLYWGTPGLDTAATVIQALEGWLSRDRVIEAIEALAAELGLDVEIQQAEPVEAKHTA